MYGCSAGKQILVALRAAARRHYGAIRYGLPDWVRQFGGDSAELDASARNSKGVRGFDSTWTTVCFCLVRPWPTDPSTGRVALQEIVIARNPETMEVLHRYLSGERRSGRASGFFLEGEEGALSNHQLEAVRDRAATEENRIRVRALLDRPLG